MNLKIELGFTSDKESVVMAQIPEAHVYMHRGGAIGGWLTEILNMDFSLVSQIVAEYFSDIDDAAKDRLLELIFMQIGDSYMDDSAPTNHHEVFEKIKNQFPIIDVFYNLDNWSTIVYDFWSPGPDYQSQTHSEVEEFKLFVAELIKHPEWVDYEYLEFLNRHDFIPPFTVPSPSIEYQDGIQIKNPCPGTDISEFLDYAHREYVSCSKDLLKKKYTYSVTEHSRFAAILVSSLLELARNSKTIRKCANCGRYFIPQKRSDTMYCDAVSPQSAEMTCKQYGSQRLWYEKQRNDEISKLSRNILSSKGMLAKRNPDIPEYAASYAYFKAKRLLWKKAVRDGTKTNEEYKQWLLVMKRQKVIRGACDGTY